MGTVAKHTPIYVILCFRVQLSHGTKHSKLLKKQAVADMGLGWWQWWEAETQNW
jgi:hypothetical protein